MKKKILLILSHILVAAMASTITLRLTLPQGRPKLQQLTDIIRDYYVEDVDLTAVEDAAADAMVSSLGDRWSYYIPASQYAEHVEQTENAYVGVGITILVREDGKGLDIMSVEEAGPAWEAGIRPGDTLTEAAGQSLEGMDATQVRSIVRGEEGTTVELTVLRAGKKLTFTVERRQVQMTVAEGTLLPGNVGLVTIYNFDARCAEESIAAIEDLREQGAERLIFDVRNNG